jgi:hypothetical protein
VILAHRLFHLMRKREHAGPAPTFEHPVLREDHSGDPLAGNGGTLDRDDDGTRQSNNGTARRNGGTYDSRDDDGTRRGSGGSSRTGPAG